MTRQGVVNFFQVGSLLLLLVAAALLAAITTMHFAIHGAEVQVPVLKGMTVLDARSQTSGLGLNLDVDNRYYSADVAAGHILTQSPAPGTVVRREWRVRVSESLGPQMVEVPDTVGEEQRVAALKLRRVGLNVGVTAFLPYGSAAEGTVLAQDPPGHAEGIAKHQPAGGRRERRCSRRICDARPDRPADCECARGVGRGGDSCGDSELSRCAGRASWQRRRGAQTAGCPGCRNRTAADCRLACGSDDGCEAGSGEVRKAGVRGEGLGVRRLWRRSNCERARL
jgi:hypothetical protein